MKEFLIREIKSLTKVLAETDPTERGFNALIDSIRGMWWALDDLSRFETCGPILDPTEPVKTEPVKTEPVSSKSEPVAEPVPTPVVAETKEELTAITKEMVREKLMEVKAKKIKIQPILEKFIPEGKTVAFSSVPVSSYPAFMEALNNAG